MNIYDIEVIKRVDLPSGEDQQELEMKCKFMDNGKEYEADITGLAFIDSVIFKGDSTTPDYSESDVSFVLTESPIFHRGLKVPLFNLDMNDDILVGILEKHCL